MVAIQTIDAHANPLATRTSRLNLLTLLLPLSLPRLNHLLPRPPLLVLDPPLLPLDAQPLLQRRHRRPCLNRLAKRRNDVIHDMVHLLRHAPAVRDGDDVAGAQRRGRIVHEDFGEFVEFLSPCC